ncbi:MAG: hypothetical protein ACI89U_000805, partial [Gammaproteobacteria bacterium]
AVGLRQNPEPEQEETATTEKNKQHQNSLKNARQIL